VAFSVDFCCDGEMIWPGVAALLLALAVGMGAFGAHALKGRFDAYQMGIWEKAVFYHFVHALGVLLVSLLGRTNMVPDAAAGRICLLLVAGIALFSGSLYTLALSGVVQFGAVTPLGGVSFIAAWIWLAFELLRNSRN
jgi:uncharacterized membrane protein YgdD (TMEM256/DUF423 family)